MYLEHFGLEKQPFRAIAQGDEVYVGPRQARALANLKIALAVPDAIAAVTGPVGVGKTTLVNRVLDLVAPKRTVARVGRTPMTAEELLEHLLAEFGISTAGSGRIERLRTLRQFFKDCGATRVRAIVLVEDANALDTGLGHGRSQDQNWYVQRQDQDRHQQAAAGKPYCQRGANGANET